MGEWEKVRLADLIDIKHGFAFQGEFFSSDGPGDLLVTPGNFAFGGGFQRGKPKYYNGPVSPEYVLRAGDVIVTMTDLSKSADTLGYAAVVPAADRVLLHNQRIGKILKRSNRVDLSFLHWLMRSQNYRNEVLASASGSTVKHTSPTKILAFEFLLPSLGEQQAIAATLDALDDKIGLNLRMNKTLETTARAIFNDWFIEFGPTRAKQGGHAPYLAPNVWALFPDHLDHAGRPHGWARGDLGSVLAVLETGGRPKGGVSGFSKGIPSVGAESIVNLGYFDYGKTKYIPEDFFHSMNKGHVESRDVLLYKDGGKPGLFEPHVTLFGDGFPFTKFAINEHVYRMRALDDFGQNCLFFWLSSEAVKAEMRIKGTGVAIPGLNSTQVKSLSILVPGLQTTRALDNLLNSFVTRILANCNESRTLARTRDFLIPKLMAGEVRVKDIEKIVTEASTAFRQGAEVV